ncbi:PCSK2 [Mytilus coruscus]|uniref:PCSK2 n=1 Tax=Mytilus coruscus TaxID=42192 RepID=A0A6J7ZZQ3_MYTCO|nr:PCSK2 [Mytilus coruscus]
MSAGNDGPRFNTNTFSLRNSIYAIIVSAVNAKKEPPSYAPVGSSIMVVAYGGDDDLEVNLLNPISDCSKMDSGTSIAAPTVSGVVALVLEAREREKNIYDKCSIRQGDNFMLPVSPLSVLSLRENITHSVVHCRPDLSWRDVQHLIVCTTNTNLKGTLVEWQRNGAGFLTHPRLGFGLIDAYKMASLAEQWMLVPRQFSCNQSKRSEVTVTGRFRSDNIFIDCDPLTTCQDCGCQIRYLEHIKVKVSFSWNGEHWFNAAYRGLVELYLISPRGTKSYILTNRPADRLQPETFTWEFKSVQSWGENPCGTFLLSFGTRSNNFTG